MDKYGWKFEKKSQLTSELRKVIGDTVLNGGSEKIIYILEKTFTHPVSPHSYKKIVLLQSKSLVF